MNYMQAATDTMEIQTINPSIVAILGLVLTGLIFPVVIYFFKKNERLHEETKSKVSEHGSTLVLHEYRIFSLEEWRKYEQQGKTLAASVPTMRNET